MLTADQHEAVAQWLVFKGQAVSLADARTMLDRALAHAKAKRGRGAAEAHVASTLGARSESERELRVSGADVVVEAERILAAAGAEGDYVTTAAALEEAERRVGRATVQASESDRVAHHTVAVLGARGLTLETCSQDEYVEAYAQAERETLGAGGRS